LKKNNFIKKSKPLVSIIVNSHNGEKFLEKSISSIIKQNYKKWEVIFWDNCSSDNSRNILKKFRDKRIKYFYSKKFYSLYKSRNLAISKAKGKYICFLDVDDHWKNNKLLEQINSIEKSNSKFIYSNFDIKNKIKNKTYVRHQGVLPEGNITQNLLNNYFIGIHTVMIKKEVFRNNKFNEKYDIIGDFELFIKLSTKYKFTCVQKSLAVYNFHGENLSLLKKKKYLYELKNWLKKNEKSMSKKFNINQIKLLLLKLKIKNFLTLFSKLILGRVVQW
jgi:glycosyltransferase involved in cell wall biosynthesis